MAEEISKIYGSMVFNDKVMQRTGLFSITH